MIEFETSAEFFNLNSNILLRSYCRSSQCFILFTVLHWMLPSNYANIYFLVIFLPIVSSAFKHYLPSNTIINHWKIDSAYFLKCNYYLFTTLSTTTFYFVFVMMIFCTGIVMESSKCIIYPFVHNTHSTLFVLYQSQLASRSHFQC